MPISQTDLYRFFWILIVLEFFLALLTSFPVPIWTVDHLLRTSREGGISTWFSVIQLFSLALLSFANKGLATQSRSKNGWVVLGLMFLYLSMDESAAIHETVSPKIFALFDSSKYLPGNWQLVFLPFILLGAGFLLWILYSEFRHNKQHLRWASIGLCLWILSLLAEFVGGKLGLLDVKTLPALRIAAVEEFCEMAGATCFLLTLGLWRFGRTQTSP